MGAAPSRPGGGGAASKRVFPASDQAHGASRASGATLLVPGIPDAQPVAAASYAARVVSAWVVLVGA
jgi:hypothetical protein